MRARGPVETGEEQTLAQFCLAKFWGPNQRDAMRSPRAAPGRICLRALDRGGSGRDIVYQRPPTRLRRVV
jgi:hypothetical protein